MASEAQHGESAVSDRLDSWKAVAAYLNRDVRTVQRWERSEGLPVHRHVHGERGSIYALRSEIDRWRDARQAVPAQPARGTAFTVGVTARLVLGAAAAAAVALIWWTGHPQTADAARTRSWDPPRVLASLTENPSRVRTIRLPSAPGSHVVDLVLSPDGARLYAVNAGGLDVIDTASLAIVHRFDAAEPSAVVVTPDGRRVFVGLTRGNVLAIDTRAMTAQQVATHARVHGLALSEDGRTLYVAAEFGGLLAVDTTSGVVTSLSRLPCPVAVAAAPRGQRLFVGYQCDGPGGRPGHDTIDVLDTATNASVGLIAGLANVGGLLAVSPDGAQLWEDGRNACSAPAYDHVGCPSVPSGIINVVRTSDRTLLRSLAIGVPDATRSTVSFTPDGMRAIVGHASVDVLDTANLAIVESAAIPLPGRVVFAPDGATAYAAAGTDSAIMVLPIRRSPAPPDGLTGRWLADGTANDAVGAAHGRPDGAVSYSAGRIGQAFRFEGTGGAIRIGEIGNLGIFSHPFTVAAWVNFPSSGATAAPMTIVSRFSAQAQRGWILVKTGANRFAACFAGARTRCDAPNAATLSSTTLILPDRWYHVGLVFTGDTAQLYVDGRLDAQTAVKGFADHAAEPLWVGADAARRWLLQGLIDEIEIYERALSAGEIRVRADAATR